MYTDPTGHAEIRALVASSPQGTISYNDKTKTATVVVNNIKETFTIKSNGKIVNIVDGKGKIAGTLNSSNRMEISSTYFDKKFYPISSTPSSTSSSSYVSPAKSVQPVAPDTKPAPQVIAVTSSGSSGGSTTQPVKRTETNLQALNQVTPQDRQEIKVVQMSPGQKADYVFDRWTSSLQHYELTQQQLINSVLNLCISPVKKG